MDINLNIVRNNNEEHLYDEDDLYFEFNNAGYYSIV